MTPPSSEDAVTPLKQLMDHIGQALRVCFKSTQLPPSSLNSLVKGLTCVALGLRPAHLIDVCHVSSNQSQILIAQLHKHRFGKILAVMHFKDRYTFVCHKSLLQEHVNATLSSPDRWRYIDIRGKQGPPRQRTCPAVLLYWLQERLLPQLQRHYCYFDVVPCYMVVLTGWFLEYPVLYCSHDDDTEGGTPAASLVDHELDEWEVRPNCLGDRPLCLVQIWIHRLFDDDGDRPHLLLSFTYPDEMDLPDPVVQNLAAKYKNRLESKNSHSPWVDLRLQHITLDRVAL
ncbi:hypothetical protein BX666DRAFT_1935429 [Dichotomocladium elegans]|nr:hypothetical protein BX666DRAFT_1935429 [Dichotomocladium elegans]